MQKIIRYRIVLSRLYTSLCILIFFISNIITINSMYRSIDKFQERRMAYSKFITNYEKQMAECNLCKSNNLKNKKSEDNCVWECSDALYDEQTGEFSKSESSYGQVTKLEYPIFHYGEVVDVVLSLFLLPIAFLGFKKWLIWCLNLK